MKQLNLQDAFLNNARKNNITVTIHVTNGFQIKNAKIVGYDNYVVILECDDKQMMLFKHAISSITPDKKIDLIEKETQE